MTGQIRVPVLTGLFAAALSFGLAPQAQAFLINPGDVPGGKGGTTETYTIPCAKSATCPTGSVTVKVDVTRPMSREDKSAAIVDAFTAQHPELNATAQGKASVSVPGATAGITSSGTTGEADRFAMATGPGYGSTAFAGALTGLGFDGSSQAEYFVEFGDDSFLATSDIFYGSLADKTLGGLATATYDNLLAALPTALQGDLSLDLSSDTITFAFDKSSSNPFDMAFALDPGVTRTQTLAFLPEPGVWAMMLIGLGAVGVVIRGARRRTGQVPASV